MILSDTDTAPKADSHQNSLCQILVAYLPYLSHIHVGNLGVGTGFAIDPRVQVKMEKRTQVSIPKRTPKATTILKFCLNFQLVSIGAIVVPIGWYPVRHVHYVV